MTYIKLTICFTYAKQFTYNNSFNPHKTAIGIIIFPILWVEKLRYRDIKLAYNSNQNKSPI